MGCLRVKTKEHYLVPPREQKKENDLANLMDLCSEKLLVMPKEMSLEQSMVNYLVRLLAAQKENC